MRRLHFRVFGWPLPRTSWLFNGRERNHTLWHDQQITEDPRGLVVGGRMLTEQLNLLEGNYTLIATNSQGNVSRSLHVDLQLGQIASGKSLVSVVLTSSSLSMFCRVCYYTNRLKSGRHVRNAERNRFRLQTSPRPKMKQAR